MYRTFKHYSQNVYLDYSPVKQHIIASTELNNNQCYKLNLKDNTISRVPTTSLSTKNISTNELLLISKVLKQLQYIKNIPEKILSMDFFELHN